LQTTGRKTSKISVLIRPKGSSLAIGDLARRDFDHTDFMTAGMGDAFGSNDHGHSAITHKEFRNFRQRHQWTDDWV
ncbi:MAG TPA: hypothetical protein PK497_06650, partial [Burkholderiaceae bacterium]|nr:hypothetical protein [Burkholderiaceae bacterium]